MPLTPPPLDDRKFADLLAEAQARVRRYCPDWTNFNDSDPGATLVQLFAWFTELMIYRLNQVPALNYVKFLQMLNLELQPARPATTFVCFTPGDAATSVSVPERTRFQVPATDGTTTYFETKLAFDLNPYRLDVVRVLDGLKFQDVSAANETGTNPFYPLGWSPQVGNALYLGFLPHKDEINPTTGPPKAPRFPNTVALRFYPPPPPSSTPGVATGSVPQQAPQKIVWEYQSKLDLATGQSAEDLDRWRPLALLLDDTLALTREGTVTFRGPPTDMIATMGGTPTSDKLPRYWIRGRLAQGLYPANSAPALSFVKSNPVEVENLATYADEVLGESDGFRREYALRNKPVDPTSIHVVTEPLTGDPWKPVDHFFGFEPDDKVYMLNATTGKILFGDGQNGSIPPPGFLVVATSYRSGGGSAGNVGPDVITTLPIGVASIDAVTNPRAATGGADEESVDALTKRAPQVLKGDGRAVTAHDYERIAKEETGVANVAVLERWHPSYPGFEVPGCVTVVVVPGQPPTLRPGEPPQPQPPQAMLDNVSKQLQKFRTLGTELFVTGPHYKRIDVRATILPTGDASEGQAIDAVQTAIGSYLAPTGWPFGQKFYPSRLYDVILTNATVGNLLAVQSVTSLSLDVDGSPADVGQEVTFEPDQLPAVTVTANVPPSNREGG